MLAKDLAEILLQNPDKEVHFVIGDGGCSGAIPVETVEVFERNILLDCQYQRLNIG